MGVSVFHRQVSRETSADVSRSYVRFAMLSVPAAPARARLRW